METVTAIFVFKLIFSIYIFLKNPACAFIIGGSSACKINAYKHFI